MATIKRGAAGRLGVIGRLGRAGAARVARAGGRRPAGGWWRALAWAGVALGLLGVIALGLGWSRLQPRAVLATSYAARLGCTCHYVDGRDIKACRADFEPGTALVLLSDDAARQTVTARLLPLAATSATYHPGQGCLLEHWGG